MNQNRKKIILVFVLLWVTGQSYPQVISDTVASKILVFDSLNKNIVLNYHGYCVMKYEKSNTGKRQDGWFEKWEIFYLYPNKRKIPDSLVIMEIQKIN